MADLSNRTITLIQLDSSRALWKQFIEAVKEKGFKEKVDFFLSPTGNTAAGFKAAVANSPELADLRKKYRITSFGIESTASIRDILNESADCQESPWTSEFKENMVEKDNNNNNIDNNNSDSDIDKANKHFSHRCKTKTKSVEKQLFNDDLDLNDKLEEALKDFDFKEEGEKEVFESYEDWVKAVNPTELKKEGSIILAYNSKGEFLGAWDDHLEEGYIYTNNNFEEEKEEEEEENLPREEKEYIIFDTGNYAFKDLLAMSDEEINKLYNKIKNTLEEEEKTNSEDEEEEYFGISTLKPNEDFDKLQVSTEEFKDWLKSLSGKQGTDLMNVFRTHKLHFSELVPFYINNPGLFKRDMQKAGIEYPPYFTESLTETEKRIAKVLSEQNNKINPLIDFSYFEGYEEFDNSTKEYALLNAMEQEEWEKYLNNMAAAGVIVEYNPEKDAFIVKNSTGIEEEKEQEESYGDIEESLYESIKNLVISKGAKLIFAKEIIKESKRTGIMKVMVEKFGYNTQINYDDNAIIKPWSIGDKRFNFIQEAIDFIQVPSKKLLEDFKLKQIQQTLKKKKLQESKIKPFTNKTDNLPLTEVNRRLKKGNRLLKQWLTDEQLGKLF
jgi:translation elongation factor EF-1beta